MSNIRPIDMLLLDDLFEMGGGYVLDFSDRTFTIFFADELNIDIDDPAFKVNGTSKAKRLRCFLQSVDKATVARSLNALWEYREALRERSGKAETINNAHGKFLELLNRINGQHNPTPKVNSTPVAFNSQKIAQLKQELIGLSSLPPQARGYAFEKFLKQLFDVHGLEAESPFRTQGEQIDGSFKLNSEIYLLEAKWQDQPIGAADLHIFHGKIEQKAAWTRGLFVSNSGFSEDGLIAFGRGKRVICMDGYDLYETLNREIPLNYVLERKIRRAAETGSPFIRVRDLFPN